MSKVAYIYKKKNNDVAWSSVISELGDFLQKECNAISVFTVDNTSLFSLKRSKKEIENFDLQRGDSLIFNHAITFWLLLPLMIKFRISGVKLIYLCHEHEHILGIRYVIRYFRFIRLKEILRHFRWWYRIPFFLSHRVVCLSGYQGIVLGHLEFERISYIGIDRNRFPAKYKWDLNDTKLTIMFAHDPERFDKGNRFCSWLLNDSRYTLVYGRQQLLPYDQVYKKYHTSDMIFLPSDSESFSLVLAEALATNSCVITNANVGIVQLLLGIYTVSELEMYGLFICHHNVESYQAGIERASLFLKRQSPTTFKLFDILALESSSCFKRLANFIQGI